MRHFRKIASVRRDVFWGGVAVFALIVLTCFFWTLIPASSLIARAQTIKPGDVKEKVRDVLGKPTQVFIPSPQSKTNILALMFTVQNEAWAYGHEFEFQSKFPYFGPRWRFFGPRKEDVAFDSSGKVLEVTIPKPPGSN